MTERLSGTLLLSFGYAHAMTILFPCSTQLSTKFILLINVKMPNVSMINKTSESLKARKVFIFQLLVFMSS